MKHNLLAKKLPQFFWHYVYWIIYILFDQLLALGFLEETPPFFLSLFHYAVNIAFFYFLCRVALPWAARNIYISIYKIPMALLGVLGLYVLSKYSLDYLLDYFYHTKWSDGGLSVRDACGYLYRFSFYIFNAFAYFYLSRFFDEREQRYKLLEFKFNQELTDKARGRHHYGNSEIFNVIADGHFLYGSLNYLLSQTPQHDHNSREMLIGIADTLRYLTNRSDFTAPRTIQQEVAQMELRVRMRKIRSSDFVAPEIECPTAVLSKKIASGILLPLFESLTRMYPNQDQLVASFKFSLSPVGINVFLKYPVASQSQLLEKTIEYVSIRIDQQYGSSAGISRYQDECFSYLNIQFP